MITTVRTRWWVRVVVVALIASWCLIVPAQSTAAVRDEVTVAGYHFPSDHPADVVASYQTNLVFRYVAGESLTDGTMIIDLPTAAWRTALTAVTVLHFPPASPGNVVVRPAGVFEPTSDECRAADGEEVTWAVINTFKLRRVVVRHLDCDPGQQIAVRIVGIKVPKAVGTYRFPIRVSDANGAHRVTQPRLKVLREPRTQLKISVTSNPVIDVPTGVMLRALRPNGRVDRSYRGSVELRTEPYDCTFQGPASVLDFTAEDAGVKLIEVTFRTEAERKLQVSDIANKARPGTSGTITPSGDVPEIIWCPISFH